MTDNTQPEALIDLIDAYAETRHRCGGVYNAKTEAARKAVIEALSGVQALSAAPRTPTVEQVEDEVSMGHGAWDMVDPQELIGAVLRLSVAASPPAEQQAAPKAAAVVWLSSKQLRGITALHGQYLPFRLQPEGRFDVPVYLEQAAPKAAQAVVQDDLITLRKPTTSAELLWLLKLAHLVISDVDKTLEETFSPAQPAEQQPQGAAYAVLPDERAAFEAQFPVPVGVHWDGTEYVVKDSHVSSYHCYRFEGQWEAWKARASHGQAPASVLHLVNSAFAEIAMAFPKAFALHKVGIADKAVLEALAAPVGARARSNQMTDKPTPTTDLLKRCAEIHEWRSTGVLSGEALRDYAKRKWPDRHDTLQMAEHETVTEALALLAKWGQPQQEAQEPVATLHCNDIGYVWARATEVGTRMRFEQPINLYTAPQPAPAPLSEQDPLQGAANWLAQAHGQFCVSVLQGCLMIGHNRAKRLHDAALAAQGGKA